MERLNKKIHFLYNITQLLLLPVLFPPLTAYALSKEKYRRLFFRRLGIGLKKVHINPLKKKIWIHCLSLGEFNGAVTLIKKIKTRFDNYEIILSASTSTGLAAIKNSFFSKEVKVISFPYDINFVVKRFVNYLRPDIFILIETDIWPNLLWELKRKGTKVILVNGSISSHATKKLKRFPLISNYIYSPFYFLGMQSEDDKKRLISLGIKKDIKNLGNIKFDISPPVLSQIQKKELLKETGFESENKIFIAGSTHWPEEKIFLELFPGLLSIVPELRLIIAPRDVKRGKDIKNLFISKGIKTTLRTDKKGNGAHKVLILDTLGELAKFYNICQLAFVGGSLAPIGGHNILEPVALGKPVIYGPHMESFMEIAQKVHEKGAGVMVKDKNELYNAILLFLTNKKEREKAKKACLSFISQHKGATERYLDKLANLIAKNE